MIKKEALKRLVSNYYDRIQDLEKEIATEKDIRISVEKKLLKHQLLNIFFAAALALMVALRYMV